MTRKQTAAQAAAVVTMYGRCSGVCAPAVDWVDLKREGVTTGTIVALLERGLVQHVGPVPSTTYKLTSAGVRAALAIFEANRRVIEAEGAF